jgi:hypothetical protein
MFFSVGLMGNSCTLLVNKAFALAERHEMEIESDYEAWKLLLDQMKEALG